MKNEQESQDVIQLLNAGSAKDIVIRSILERAKSSGKISPSDIAKVLPTETLKLKGPGLAAIIRGIGEYLKREKVEIKNFIPSVHSKEKKLYPNIHPERLKPTGRQVGAVKEKKRILKLKGNLEFSTEEFITTEESEEIVANLYSSINSLLRKVQKYQLLTAEEEIELGRRVKDEGDLDARNEFVLHNIRLVASVATRFSWSKLPIEDLLQEGVMGLMVASEKYDYTKGYRFSTYATLWIRQHISRAIMDKADTIRVPVHVREVMNKILAYCKKMGMEKNRFPTTAVLSRELKISTESIKDALSCFLLDTKSLHDLAYKKDDSEITFGETLIDENQATPDFFIQVREELEISVQFANLMLNTVNRLRKDKPRDCEIFKLLNGYDEDGETWTLERVGNKLGITRERVRQINQSIFDELFLEDIKLSSSLLITHMWRIQELQKIANILVQL